MDRVFAKIFGYEDFERAAYQNGLVPFDRSSVKFYEQHYEKAAPFLDQDELHLTPEAKEAIRDFFRTEAAESARGG